MEDLGRTSSQWVSISTTLGTDSYVKFLQALHTIALGALIVEESQRPAAFDVRAALALVMEVAKAKDKKPSVELAKAFLNYASGKALVSRAQSLAAESSEDDLSFQLMEGATQNIEDALGENFFDDTLEWLKTGNEGKPQDISSIQPIIGLQRGFLIQCFGTYKKVTIPAMQKRLNSCIDSVTFSMDLEWLVLYTLIQTVISRLSPDLSTLATITKLQVFRVGLVECSKPAL